MLLRFGVANHRSIRDYQELFLSASRRIKREGLVIPVPTLKEAAVPIAAVYGPNAAGKSNLIDAMDEMRRGVVQSHKSLDATDRIRRAPFRLDDASEARPTRFDCTFTVGGRSAEGQGPDRPESVYEYGFEYTATEFCKEWLYRIVRRERQSTRILFERETRDREVRVKVGSRLPGENRTIANLTRPNSLFLSAAAQNNHPLLTELYQYFVESWVFVPEGEVMHETSIVDRLADYEHLERLVELVNQADVGIGRIDVKDEKHGEDVLGFVRDIVQIAAERFGDLDKNGSLKESSFGEMGFRKQLHFIHSTSEGDARTLGYGSQSKGTRTLISLLIPALEALSRGSLLVVDELDTSLHPNLARAFVSLFSKESSNPRGAQLVFSTHDVTLLGGGVVRQDEIWMTDKNREGASEFTPLTDFKLRSRDDIEKAYRDGRLGGVPAADDFLVAFDDDWLPAAER